MSLIHMAMAFVLQHPAVTAPIIGPRTMDHLESQIGAADVKLTTDILDRIDEIVPPGMTMARSTGAIGRRRWPTRSCAAAAPPDQRRWSPMTAAAGASRGSRCPVLPCRPGASARGRVLQGLAVQLEQTSCGCTKRFAS